MNREQILVILYDLALMLSSEVRLRPLLTRILQRLLYHTSFPAGVVFLNRSPGDDDIEAELAAAVGDFALMQRIGQRLCLPSALLRGPIQILEDPALLGRLPLAHQRYRVALRLTMPDTGIILLLAPASPIAPLPLAQIFQPVMANLAKAVLLCRNNEAYARSLESERVRAIDALQESERRLHTLFHNMADGVALHGPIPNAPTAAADAPTDYRIIECNPRFERIMAVSRDEAIGKQATDLYGGSDAQLLQTARAVVASGQTQRLELYFPALRKYLDISIIPWDRDGFAAVFADATERHYMQERLKWAANHDTLTQLPNRLLLSDRLQQTVSQARKTGKLLAVCYLDLDNFKPINDRWGHETGDQLLVRMAHRLQHHLRPEDTIARLGGDEFVLLLVDYASPAAIAAILQRILAAIMEPCEIPLHSPVSLSASIGVTLFPRDETDPDTLLRHADQAMYMAKQTGRNRYHFFDSDQDRERKARQDALHNIETALETGQFRLYYQPKVDMRYGRVIGAEALIRWQHPEQGLLGPNEFLPLIENTLLDCRVGDWVIQTAMAHLESWMAAGLLLTISVNISATQLQQPDFVAQLDRQLRAHPTVPPHLLELEVLESAALQDIDAVSELIKSCRRLGVNFALDDFGAGYSSLTYLKRLPVATIKIDQSFVRDMLHDPEDLAIVEGIIGLAKSFQRQVIAEGVETAEHGVQLLRLGCNLAQGYGIARPMPAEALFDWVARYCHPPLWTHTATSKSKCSRRPKHRQLPG